MIRFDLFTILILYALMTFLFAMFLISTAISMKNKFNGIIRIMLGFLFFSIGMTLVTLGDVLPFPIFTSVLLGNCLLVAGIFKLNLGIRSLFGILSESKHYWIAYILFCTIFYYFAVIDDHLAVRIMMVSSFIVVNFSISIIGLLKKAHQYQLSYLHVLMHMMIAYAITHVFKIIAAIVNYNSITEFLSYRGDMIFQVAGLLSLSLIFIYIIIILNKLLASELEDKLIENKSLILKLEHLTKLDYLTGLDNRKSLEEKTAELVNRCKENNTTFQYVIIDLNSFKEINDEFGHHFGDQVLINFGAKLQEYTPLVYRYGGDEFIILVDDEQMVAIDIMTQIEQQCSKKITKETHIPSFSYGIHTWKDGQSYNDIMTNADYMMYLNKKAEQG